MKALIDVVGDRGGLRRRKVIVYERRSACGERRCGEGVSLLRGGEEFEGLDVEGQTFLDQADICRQCIRTRKIGIDVKKHGYLSREMGAPHFSILGRTAALVGFLPML